MRAADQMIEVIDEEAQCRVGKTGRALKRASLFVAATIPNRVRLDNSRTRDGHSRGSNSNLGFRYTWRILRLDGRRPQTETPSSPMMVQIVVA